MSQSPFLPLERLQPYLRFVEVAAWGLWLVFLLFSLLIPLEGEPRVQFSIFIFSAAVYIYLLFRQLFPRFLYHPWFHYAHLIVDTLMVLISVRLLNIFAPMLDVVMGLVVVIGAMMGGRKLGLYGALLGSLTVMLNEISSQSVAVTAMLLTMRLIIYSTLAVLVWIMMDRTISHWRELTATAEQQARLFQQSRRRLAQLSALNQIGQAISAALELPQVLQTVYEQVVLLMNQRDFYIALYAEANDEIDFVFYSERGHLRPRTQRRGGNGLTEYVIRTRKPLLINNDVLGFGGTHGIEPSGMMSHSWLGVPLLKGGKVIGVMTVQDYEHENAYDEEDLELFQTLAGQVAIAIDNAHLYESTRRNLQEAAALYEFSRQVAQSDEWSLIAQAAALACRNLLKLDGVYIYAYDGSPPRLTPLAIIDRNQVLSAEQAEWFVQHVLGERALQGLVGWVIQHAQSQRLDDAHADLRYVGIPEMRSELCVPIMLQGHVLGAINVESAEPGAYSESDERFVTTLAGQLAVALESARLKEHERQRTVELSGLYEISQAFGAMGDPRATYAVVTQRIAQIFGARGAMILLYDKQRNEMRAQMPAYGLPEAQAQGFHYTLDVANRALWNPHVVPSVIANDLSLLPRPWPQAAHEFGMTRFMGAAMYGSEGLMGAIVVTSRSDNSPFTQREGQLLALFARQAALAIENARLYESERQGRQQLLMVNRVARRILSLNSLNQLMQELASAVAETSHDRLVAAFLIEGDELVMRGRAGPLADSVPEGYRQSFAEGTFGWVARTGQTYVANDAAHERYDADQIQAGLRSELAVPLSSEGKVIGVLAVVANAPNAFSAGDVTTLETVADQAAHAIVNVRFYEAEQRRANQLATISQLGREIASLLNLDELLQRSVRLIQESFHYRTVHIFLADHQQGVARLAASFNDGQSNTVTALTLKIGREGLIGKAIAERRYILENNVRQNPDYYEHPTLTDINSELVVPIRSGDKVLGALDAQDNRLNAFTQADVFILQTLTDQLAVALVNAELHMTAEHQARTDSLTQVYNHGYFLEQLRGEIELNQQRDQSLSLIMLDIDYFKQYNDRYGHVMGDRVLQMTVQAIRQNIKREDLVGRWGGEEFGVALPHTNAQEALIVAGRIRKTLANAVLRDDEEQPIEKPTVSQGIATFPQHAQSMEQLIDIADRMLYRAKAKGRDQVVLFQF